MLSSMLRVCFVYVLWAHDTPSYILALYIHVSIDQNSRRNHDNGALPRACISLSPAAPQNVADAPFPGPASHTHTDAIGRVVVEIGWLCKPDSVTQRRKKIDRIKIKQIKTNGVA
jgi:hypothetical protein